MKFSLMNLASFEKGSQVSLAQLDRPQFIVVRASLYQKSDYKGVLAP